MTMSLKACSSTPVLRLRLSAATTRIPANRYAVTPVRARTRPSVLWKCPSSNTNPIAVRTTAAIKKLRSHTKKVWLGRVPPRMLNITTPAKLATKPRTKKTPAARSILQNRRPIIKYLLSREPQHHGRDHGGSAAPDRKGKGAHPQCVTSHAAPPGIPPSRLAAQRGDGFFERLCSMG